MSSVLDRRKIAYISGTRADFGLIASTLRLIDEDPRFSLELIVTGMHLSEKFGLTVAEIEQSGLSIASRVFVDFDSISASAMAANIGHMVVGIVQSLSQRRPDILLLLGDRGEMLAGALAAIHLGIPVVHIHGGERSGTVDEPVRHAISKLANFHFVSTSASRDRLIRLGEDGENIYLVGAPGLDGLKELAVLDRFELCRRVGFKASSPVGLFVFHPVLHEAQQVETQVSIILEELLATGLQILALMPNSDAGSDAVRSVLTRFSSNDALVVETHLPRSEFVSWMASSDVMIGNSSSGIIEAATFGTPVVNIGSRQNLRERNQNIIDVPPLPNQVCAALRDALASGAYPCSNIYGDGQAGKRILELLAGLDLSSLPPFKCNAY